MSELPTAHHEDLSSNATHIMVPSTTQSDSSRLLNLPSELLQIIVGYVAPRPTERIWTEVNPPPDSIINEFAHWKDDCCALRLVCRQFIRIDAIRDAVFHTFYWFPTEQSMHRLQSIARSAALAPLVGAHSHRNLDCEENELTVY